MSKRLTFIILLHDQKSLNKEVILAHVDYLKSLEYQKRLIFSGPFKDHEGGIVIIFASTKDEAITIANQDPFINQGYKSYEIIEVIHAHQDNNYLI